MQIKVKPKEITNQLLSALPAKLCKIILAESDIIDMNFGEILCERDQPLRYVYFPLSGFISLLTSINDHPPLEMGLVGNEGMVGLTIILGVDTIPERAIVQGAGTSVRLPAENMRQLLKSNPVLLKKMKLYLYVVFVQLAQSLACIHFHNIEQRLSRWLLMTQDRAHDNQIYLTHEYLADMLGVRRSGITIAAGKLQAKNLISYTRGRVTILNRKNLENTSCECYSKSIAGYTSLLN